MLILLIIALLVAGGFYLGTGKIPLLSTMTPQTAVTTTALESPTPTPTYSDLPTTGSPTPTPTVAAKSKTISAGVKSGLSFNQYTIQIPDGWAYTQAHEDAPSPMDTLTMTKNGYTLKIFQAATGGAMCVYPGDPEPEGPASTFTSFVTIKDGDGKDYRRAQTTSGGAFTLCQNSQYGWGQPTSFGHISFSTPNPADPTILQEMDAIFGTLKKI